jgi:uncharacterized HAD superfamily protein
MKVRIMLDMDGVIANFYNEFAKYLNDNYGCTLNTEIAPKNYPFESWGHGVDKINFAEASNNWINQNGFEKIPAFDGVKEFVKELSKLYDVHIVTARIGDWEQNFTADIKNRIKKNTHNWLKKQGISACKLYFVHDKVPFCKELGISIIIEDKLETALNAAKEKIHAILIDRNYNHSKANRLRVYRAHNFKEVLDQIKRLTK